jgi:hypothetical protein
VTARSKPAVDPRIGERDAGLRRLRRATALGLAAAGALSLVFGDLAARAFHGRSSAAKTRVTVRTSAASQRVVATPPPLVSAGSAAQAAAAAAAQAPAQSQAPPVAVSGGT